MGSARCRRLRWRWMCITAASRWSKSLARQCGAPFWCDCLSRTDGQSHLSGDQYDVWSARSRTIIRVRAMRAADAAGRRAGLEADGLFALGHGVPEDQGSRRARDRAGLWGAADAAGHPGRCDLCQLSGSQPGLLPPDRVAAGDTGGRGTGGLVGSAYAARTLS